MSELPYHVPKIRELEEEVETLRARVAELEARLLGWQEGCVFIELQRDEALDRARKQGEENAALRTRAAELEEEYRQACIDAHEAASQRNRMETQRDEARELPQNILHTLLGFLGTAQHRAGVSDSQMTEIKRAVECAFDAHLAEEESDA